MVGRSSGGGGNCGDGGGRDVVDDAMNRYDDDLREFRRRHGKYRKDRADGRDFALLVAALFALAILITIFR